MRFSYFLILPAVCFLGSCGVETGTDAASGGELSQLFHGRFFDASASPLSGVSATLLENGAECTSADDGVCEIETIALAGDLELLVEVPGRAPVSVILSEVPGDGQTVYFDVRIEGSGNDATLTAISFGEAVEPPAGVETPAASETPGAAVPTRTPAPTATPNPVAKGKKVFQSTCGTCHAVGKGDGLSADQLSQTLALSQHRAVRLSTSQIRDLVEFLNR